MLTQVIGRVRVVTKATKLDYYTELANSRVQLNTARQDFISYTAIEASTFVGKNRARGLVTARIWYAAFVEARHRTLGRSVNAAGD